jgi:hypothetical protein
MDVPILYMAILRRRAHKIPPTLLPTMVREKCTMCSREVLASRIMLRQARAACRREGRKLQVVCQECGERSKREADVCSVYTPDTKPLAKYFRQG